MPPVTDLRKAVRASHHLLLGHARAVQVYRSLGLPGRIGITLDLQVATPDGDSDENRRAAELGDGYSNRWFLDPLFRARYPSDVEACSTTAARASATRWKPGTLRRSRRRSTSSA